MSVELVRVIFARSGDGRRETPPEMRVAPSGVSKDVLDLAVRVSVLGEKLNASGKR